MRGIISHRYPIGYWRSYAGACHERYLRHQGTHLAGFTAKGHDRATAMYPYGIATMKTSLERIN